MLRTFDYVATFQDCMTSFTARMSKKLGLVLSLIAGMMLLTACEREWTTDYDDSLAASDTANWRVSKINVTVPEDLTVSDKNSFAPHADIVWHGDPAGDRRAQVRAITQTALQQAVHGLNGSRPVVLDVVIMRFHGVTPITVNRSPGAVHNLRFTAQVRDSRSGTVLASPTLITAELAALVGEEALNAAQFGPTQKQRVTSHIAATFSGWLGTGPDVRNSFISVGR